MKVNKTVIAYILIGLVFFSYVFLRAIKVGATYDEVVTLQEFVPKSIYDILFNARPIANNHILNTIFIKVLFLFGNRALFLARVPSLVAFLLYLYFSYKLLSDKVADYYGVGCFTLLICNPFMLEFFSLARGYGLSIAFMMGALYFAAENIDEFSISTLYKSLALGALSVISIFSMVYFEISLALILNAVALLKEGRSTLKRSLTHSTLVGIVLLSVIAVPIIRLVKYHALSYGGERGFYSDTLLSLVRYTIGDFEPSFFAPLVLNSFLAIIVFVVGLFFLKKSRDSMLGVLVSVCVLLVALTILSHKLIGVRYPIDRVGLFLYPIMILPLCLCLRHLKRFASKGLLAALVLGSLYNFICRANFYKTTLWDFDSHTFRILGAINDQGRAEERVVSLGMDSIFKKSVSYYVASGRYESLKVLNKGDDAKREGGFYLHLSRNVFPDADFVRHDKDRVPSEFVGDDIFIEYPREQIIVFRGLRGHSPD